MDGENINNYIDSYKELLAKTPDEIKDFLWSDAFKAIINGIKKAEGLSEKQSEAVEDVIFDITIGAINEAEAKNKLNFAKISQSSQEKIFLAAFDYVVFPAINKNYEIVEDFKIDEYTEKDNNELLYTKKELQEDVFTTKTNFNPTVLSNLNKKLNTLDSVSPVERVHIQKNIQDDKKLEDIRIRKIDPYREIPE